MDREAKKKTQVHPGAPDGTSPASTEDADLAEKNVGNTTDPQAHSP